jgi:hypothetical protein
MQKMLTKWEMANTPAHDLLWSRGDACLERWEESFMQVALTHNSVEVMPCEAIGSLQRIYKIQSTIST